MIKIGSISYKGNIGLFDLHNLDIHISLYRIAGLINTLLFDLRVTMLPQTSPSCLILILKSTHWEDVFIKRPVSYSM